MKTLSPVYTRNANIRQLQEICLRIRNLLYADAAIHVGVETLALLKYIFLYFILKYERSLSSVIMKISSQQSTTSHKKTRKRVKYFFIIYLTK